MHCKKFSWWNHLEVDLCRKCVLTPRDFFFPERCSCYLINKLYIYSFVSFYLSVRCSYLLIDSVFYFIFTPSRYEQYLWENERQSYLRHAILFGFFVQLDRIYTDTVQKLPTNSESNIMRCSTVPRFKYLPIRLEFCFFSQSFRCECVNGCVLYVIYF